MKILTNYDFNGNEIQNVKIQNLASPPPSPTKGMIYFNTTLNRVFVFNGEDWEEPSGYTLPVAGTSLGGVKAGGDVTINASGEISVNDNSHNHTIENITGLQNELNSKETPAGASAKASVAENNAKSYTDSKLAELVGSAPEALDTLYEIAEALGSDPNFATTILTSLAEKTKKYTQQIGNGSDTVIEVSHGLNSRDVIVQLRETASPYAVVITDVEMTTTNKITLRFAKAPTTNEYTVTIIG